MKAIVVTEFGGPEVLRMGEIESPALEADDVRIRVAYAGVNFLDLHHRSGTYPRVLPFVPGREGAGVIIECGRGVRHLREGDRVAFAMHEGGAYAEEVLVPAWKVAPVPDAVDLSTAAAVMLQGLTALSLVVDEANVQQGQIVLVHSAAGGTGSLIVKIARHRGARVIALASSDAKAQSALRAGAAVAGTYPREGFSGWVRAQTGGRGVDVIFDAVGGPTFDGDLDCLASRGRLVIYGRSGGAFGPMNPARLANGCLSVTYSRLGYYVSDFETLQSHAAALFELVAAGVARPEMVSVCGPDGAAAAHAALESRTSLGKCVIDMSLISTDS